MTPVPLYQMFPFLKGNAKLTADYTKVQVVSVTVTKNETQMEIALSAPDLIPPYEIAALEGIIKSEYDIEDVNIRCSQFKSSAIMGRVTKTTPKPMGDITPDDGTVTVRGHVFAVRSKYNEKNNAWRLNFDIADNTGAITVNRYNLQDKTAEKIVNAIKIGAYLTVSGKLVINNYDGELTLNPQNIFTSEEEKRADTSPKKRVELHLHTKMSALDGLTDVSEVIKRASQWGHKAIAITDHGVVHAFPEAAKTASKLKGTVKIIYGIEGYIRNDVIEHTEHGKTSRKRHHVILLAKNETGLKNLYKLVSISHTEHFLRGRPTMFKSILEKHRDGLIIGSACERGEFFTAVTSREDDEHLKEIAKFYDYLEIQPISNNMFMINGKEPIAKSVGDLQDFNRKVVEIGKELNIPTVATCDVHFLDLEHEIYRKIVLPFDNINEDLPLYFRTTEEMLEEFCYLGEDLAHEIVVENTNKIADMCEVLNPVPPDTDFFPPTLENSAKELKEIIDTNAPVLYGESPPDIISERIKYELNDILGLNYDVIYMAAQKLVAYLKTKRSRVGSRGSIGSSFVAYLAGITEVNPLPAHYRCPSCKISEFPGRYACGADMPNKVCPACGTEFIKDGFNIPFETFMGFGGEKIPDIDLNISGQHHNKALKFVYDMFGKNYVYRAGTISTIKEKNAYKLVMKHLESTGQTATKANINRLIAGCLGVKQTTGQHPGGLIVIPQDKEVYDFCPVQYPSDDKEKGVVTLHFEYDYFKNNLIKLDLLGHDNPTMLTMLEDLTGVNADEIKLDDPDTMSIFSSPKRLGFPDNDEIIGKTGAIGIPEFGTPFARQMLCDTNPRDFDTLIRLSGYSHGTNVWIGNAKNLIATKKAAVAETISSRDDIMLYLISKGMVDKDAFAISESVRNGKGLPVGAEAELRRLKVPPWYIESCNKISYLFPKAHAVAYVIMAFRIAWFKVHRPLEYYAAHFYRRSQNNAFDAFYMTRGIDAVIVKIQELRRFDELTKKDEELLITLESCYEFYKRGFDFAPIDLYESEAEYFTLAGSVAGSDNGRRLLRPPFVAVSGLGAAAALALVKERENREFISIDEISAACSPALNKTNIEQLKQLGALRGLPDSSQMSLF